MGSSGMQSHCLGFNSKGYREGPQMVSCITATLWGTRFGKDRLPNTLRIAEAAGNESV